jgi:hypothetical protein
MANRNRRGADTRATVYEARGVAQRKQHRSTDVPDVPVALRSVMARFEPHINELLKMAAVKSDANARSALVNALQFAEAGCYLEGRSQDRAPSELVEQLEGSIKKTLALLRRITTHRYSRDLGFVMHPVGSGVIDIATVQEMIRGRTLDLPRHPSISDAELRFPSVAADGMWAVINIEPLLRAVMIKLAKRKRSQPKKLGKEETVFYAAQFFCLYSSIKPSNDPNNRFPKFAKRFYEAVTGNDIEPGRLDWQIRKVLKDRRAGG